ncbi:hypothetical protein C8F01DRAFT_1043491 [Mycena amicta]|nr:hypothetical protein C8F01DRAFT_1043491 [Mycena amicta]
MRPFLSLVAAMNAQSVLNSVNSWNLELSRSFRVLGPFPQHAREQHFLSPSFPINISEPLDFAKTYPSAYADNGTVGWSTTEATEEGHLSVSFPDIRWSDLRATEGWSALQHHAVLLTTLTVFPPTSGSPNPPRLLVQLIQGSYFTILDSELSTVPEWHAGNIYAMDRTLPRAVDLPTAPSTTSPTTYLVFVSGDYEIRLFGGSQGKPPTQTIQLTIDIESPALEVVLEPSQNVVCDFVDGYTFGDAFGIGLRSLGGWWTISSARAENFAIELSRSIIIAPSQTRIVPLRILQTAQYLGSTIDVVLTISSKEGREIEVATTLAVNQLPADAKFIYASYFSAGVPTLFTAISPVLENNGPPILALHGAGVDIVSHSFWADSLPRQQDRWIVAPSGRTSWGLDWHGASAKEAWSCVDALVSILHVVKPSTKLEDETPVLLMGHSNGGQGAWYLASRFPDRVLGVVPTAGYIKSQAYVALPMSRSAHFIDPSVRAILETSLTPDDNDLFLSNLVDTPIFAIHGGADDNVPVWHSREAVGILKTWNAKANATFREDPGMQHWYPEILDNDQVQSFVHEIFSSRKNLSRANTSFTLTVAIPAESGSLHGLRIDCLVTPGRLARLTAHIQSDNKLHILTTNVERFSIISDEWDTSSIYIDNHMLEVSDGAVSFERQRQKIWKVATSIEARGPQPSGRIQSFLSSSGPFQLVVLDGANPQHLSLALRIAHDLNAYHRLDSELLIGYEALQNAEGNILIIGNTSFPDLADILKDSQTPFRVDNHKIILQDTVLDEAGLGILFLHPHPGNKMGQILFLLGTDSTGLERAGRLFPIRTGVTVPDWLITSSPADQIGAAGILGAGRVLYAMYFRVLIRSRRVYGNNWSFNDAISWLY